MEQFYHSTSPPLPTGDGICSAAVRSVNARGFHDGPHTTELYPLATAQFGRLVEEIGELIEASVAMKAQHIADESADVMIVLCQLAWLYGMNPDLLLYPPGKGNRKLVSLSIASGMLWRAIRRNDDFGVCWLIADMAGHVRISAGIHEIDIAQAMRDKIARDETRGVRHEGDKAAILDNQTADARLYGGDLTAQLQAAEQRGHDAAIAQVRAWAQLQRAMCSDLTKFSSSHNDLEQTGKWSGGVMVCDVLISYLDIV